MAKLLASSFWSVSFLGSAGFGGGAITGRMIWRGWVLWPGWIVCLCSCSLTVAEARKGYVGGAPVALVCAYLGAVTLPGCVWVGVTVYGIFWIWSDCGWGLDFALCRIGLGFGGLPGWSADVFFGCVDRFVWVICFGLGVLPSGMSGLVWLDWVWGLFVWLGCVWAGSFGIWSVRILAG